MEWAEQSKYCSFNSYKGLTYYERYKKIVDWLDKGVGELPPPVEVNLDPIAECNLRCYWCIVQDYLRNDREQMGKMRKLPTGYMHRLIDFLAKWGVHGLCISGGGEPSLHEGAWGLPSYAVSKGMEASFVTNGVVMNSELADNMMLCRWVNFSVDAGSSETFKAIKGKDMFNLVISNIGHVAALRQVSHSSVDICYSFLIVPENSGEIYKACQLAKELGVQNFHARPVDFERKDIKEARKLSYNMAAIQEQFTRCHEEETGEFHVFTVTHKFDPEFHVKHDFKRCLATPLLFSILQDGNAYLCPDRKMEPELRLGPCYPNPEDILTWWGDDMHRELIKSVDPMTCSKCVKSQYNRQIEEVVLKDGMCLSFP
jgi:MoaA/NifB/PqqE/SkfB family radical SAM enzyme